MLPGRHVISIFLEFDPSPGDSMSSIHGSTHENSDVGVQAPLDNWDSTMKIATAALAATLALVSPGAARADIITGTFTTTATGTLGGTAFTNAAVTITMTYDTTQILSPSGFPVVQDLSSSLSVAGFGPATFTGSTFTADLSGFILIAARQFSDGIFGDTATPFNTYDLTTPIGPVTGTGFFRSGAAMSTSLGDLVFNTAPTSTYTAVPEPSALALIAVGLGSVVARGTIRSRRRGSAAGVSAS
jgi:hypothetical protein